MPRTASGLGAPVRKQLRKSSREAVEAKTSDLLPHMRRKRWIAAGNEYRLHCVRRINAQTNTNPPTFNDKDLSEYVAASCALHAIDGWSFLARAFSSHAEGDADSARFFGYYAELRAAMSILASSGTGVFLNKHALVDKNQRCELIGGGGTTHRVAWEYLDYWAQRRGAKILLEEIIRPGDRKLSEWLRHSPMGAITPRLLAKRWLRSWGVDLRHMGRDKDARNESSYRPTELKRAAYLSGSEAAEFVSEFWDFFEPWPPSFGSADRYLLRTLLHESFFAVHNTQVVDALATFQSQIKPILVAIQPGGGSEEEWIKFLSNTEQPFLLQLAATKSDASDPKHHMQVMARAALLLRIATGACDTVFQAASVDRSILRFWSDRFGEMRGLWPQNAKPDSMLDLWTDVQSALTSLKRWQNDNRNSELYALRHDQVMPLQTLCECERVALWGIAQ